MRSHGLGRDNVGARWIINAHYRHLLMKGYKVMGIYFEITYEGRPLCIRYNTCKLHWYNIVVVHLFLRGISSEIGEMFSNLVIESQRLSIQVSK